MRERSFGKRGAFLRIDEKGIKGFSTKNFHISAPPTTPQHPETLTLSPPLIPTSANSVLAIDLVAIDPELAKFTLPGLEIGRIICGHGANVEDDRWRLFHQTEAWKPRLNLFDVEEASGRFRSTSETPENAGRTKSGNVWWCRAVAGVEEEEEREGSPAAVL
ncbi:hypothetical protein VNO77_30966 [Canavalia gladiata]|uniref:Uncharacterized protein n=1 Tax=Canavalia gladiata TaxID=3824 RepID=A0AAN9KSB0_CANGL